MRVARKRRRRRRQTRHVEDTPRVSRRGRFYSFGRRGEFFTDVYDRSSDRGDVAFLRRPGRTRGRAVSERSVGKLRRVRRAVREGRERRYLLDETVGGFREEKPESVDCV